MAQALTASGARAANAVLIAVLDALGATALGDDDRARADLRLAIGDLRTTGMRQLAAGTLGTALLATFRAAVSAGTTFDGFEAVRSAAVTSSAEPAALAVSAGAVRFVVAQQARLAAAAEPESRDAATMLLDAVNTSFDAAEIAAADTGATAIYRALVALHGAVVRDLTDRARRLPEIQTRDFPPGLPALALTYRLYGESSRVDVLVAENRAIHPLFMPGRVRALSE